MKKTRLMLAALAACAAASAAVGQSTEDVARVLSTTPVTEQIAVPHQVCVQQQVQTPAQKSGLGAMLGGIAGAALGNQVGQGGGRMVGTAVGAVGGAVLGNNIEGNAPQVQTVQNCRTETTYEQRVSSYNVRYEYAGKQYAVQMPYDPGPTIKVRVTPVN